MRVVLYSLQVSIHAPTRGATGGGVFCRNIIIGFNPRTHAGCDPPLPGGTYLCCQFQSTHPRGVRLLLEVCGDLTDEVSIHAPTRGATLLCNPARLYYCSFNPRTHAGCDPMLSTPNCSATQFQSTHPRGVRPKWSPIAQQVLDVSIHAPTRGATFRL